MPFDAALAPVVQAPSRKRQRRFEQHNRGLRAPVVLPPDHPAVLEGRPLFNGFVGKSLLRKGMNSRKTGWTITKGAWKGFHIYTLTLPERTTCPGTCKHWFDCYGNNMPHPIRNEPGFAFERRLEREIADLNAEGEGFVVRLHLLGDFYSTTYVTLWRTWLRRYPHLHAFGYTAWQPNTKIGAAVARLRDDHWDRFAVRTSDGPAGSLRTISIPEVLPEVEAVICPAQVHPRRDEICCATCALCWRTTKAIAFVDHAELKS
jgi:hypothetical protein